MIYIHHRTSVFFITLFFFPHVMWSVFTPCGHMDLKDKIKCPLASMSSEYNCQETLNHSRHFCLQRKKNTRKKKKKIQTKNPHKYIGY